MATQPKALIVDPDWERSGDIARSFQEIGVDVVGHANYGVEAVTLVQDTGPDIVLVRFDPPLERPASTITALTRRFPETQVIAYTRQATPQVARQAMLAGARDFLADPVTSDSLELSLNHLLRRQEHGAASGEEDEQSVALGTIITVFGAKGGIGKTTIASNLAVALAMEAGQSVALVDMDTRFGDVAVTMDIKPNLTVTDLARDLDTLTRESLPDYLVRHASGVDVVAAPGSPSEWRNVTPAHVHDVLDVLAQTHDFVVIDTPGAINELVTAAIEAGTMLLLVTTLDMASVKDTVLVQEMLEERFPGGGDRIRVVLNRAGLDIGVSEREVQRTLDRDIWARVPEDEAVSRSSQVGQPVVMANPNTRAAREIRKIAASIAGVRSPATVKGARKNGGFSIRRAFRGLFGGGQQEKAEAASR